MNVERKKKILKGKIQIQIFIRMTETHTNTFMYTILHLKLMMHFNYYESFD